MKLFKKIQFLAIRKKLEKYNIFVISNINDTEYFNGINSILKANDQEITFLLNNNYINDLNNTKAKACIISKKNISFLPIQCNAIIVDDPYKSFACLTNIFHQKLISTGVISNSAFIDKNSILSDSVQINSNVYIGKNCDISSNVIIESNCVIDDNVKIGSNTIIKANSTLSNCLIGSNCIIKSGTVIGGNGFGFDTNSKIPIKHFGNVIIKDNCNIGSNTTIDRAVFESTIINENSFIDNLVQIAHNVIIGKHAIIAAQTGIAGSTKIGNYVKIGGQTGINGHLIIGNHVTIAAKSGVTKNLKDNSIVAGFPAVDIKKWKLSTIKFNKSL